MRACGELSTNIVEVEPGAAKSQLCERVLRSLAEWFGIESAILVYAAAVKSMQT